MIYITKTIENEIITDSIIDFIPDNLEIYLDDIKLGQYENISETVNYLIFLLPVEDISTLQAKEYKMSIYNYGALIKQELIIVSENTSLSVKSINNSKQIKFYEG